MARKNKTKDAVDSAVPMKERLEKTISSIETQLKASQEAQDQAKSNEKAWQERVLYAQDMIAGTDEPDALEALGILEAQAKEYLAVYSAAAVEDNDYIVSLEDQLRKLKSTLSSLDLIEKKRELTEHLRSISSSHAVARATKEIASTMGTTESREIDSIIHTAQALIELKSAKVA
jgi:predicted  nucleic acid-binding Zn-ribbon protein